MIHTELFTQYIANNGGADNALPVLFDKVPSIDIDGEKTTFRDSFILNFCDREIGFETEQLFALKLEGRAKLVLPKYINKLTTLGNIDYLNACRTEKETRKGSGSVQDSGSDTVTRETSGNVTDSGKDTMTKSGSGSVQDSGSDTLSHSTSGNVTDSGSDKNTRFKGENPIIDTTLDFNANAVTEQETNTIEYGKTSTTTGSGTDKTEYGKKSESTNAETNETQYGKTTATTGSGTDSTQYGKATNTQETGETKREFTDGQLETYDFYERVLNETTNIWVKIFSEFESLFIQVW